MAFRHFIFDFDGTLADSADWATRLLIELAEKHGLSHVDEAEVRRLRGLPSREIVRRLRVPFWKLPGLAREARARGAKAAAEIALFPDAGPTLEALRARHARIAIVSSNAEANVRAILGPALAGLVDAYGCGASLFGKPRLLRRVIRDSGIPAAETLCVGDETRDLDAARAVGAASAAVTWGYATREILLAQRPTHLIERWEDLVALAVDRG